MMGVFMLFFLNFMSSFAQGKKNSTSIRKAVFNSYNKSPQRVLLNYRRNIWLGKHDENYDKYLSSLSKSCCSKTEFCKMYPKDSVTKLKNRQIQITEKHMHFSNDNQKLFKVSITNVRKNKSDDVIYYYNMYKENGEWKVFNANVLFDSGQKYYDNNIYDSAYTVFSKILEYCPYDGATYYYLAKCVYYDVSKAKILRYTKADSLIDLALLYEPNKDMNLLLKANINSSLGNHTVAQKYYDLSLEYCNDESYKNLILTHKVFDYIDNSDLLNAESTIKKVIKENKTNKYTWFLYGLVMFERNNYDKAMEYFNIAYNDVIILFELNITKQFLWRYIYTCLATSNCSKATESFEFAMVLFPNDKYLLSLKEFLDTCKRDTSKYSS